MIGSIDCCRLIIENRLDNDFLATTTEIITCSHYDIV